MHYAFIIPYRNRQAALEELLPHMRVWVKRQPYIHSHTYLVVEQADVRLFNLGWCINVGFRIAEDLRTRDDQWRFVFQPVDCLPLYEPRALQGTPDQVDVDVPPAAWEGAFTGYECPANTAVFLQPKWWSNGWTQFATYYKALVFDPAAYRAINGHSNQYNGWGREDDDLMLRLSRTSVQIERRAVIFDEFPHQDRQHSPDGHTATWADAANRVTTDGLSDLAFDFEWVKNPYDVKWARARTQE